MDLEPTFALAAEIHDGDFVGLYVAGVGTAVATGFLPVVTTAAVLAPIIGRVVDEPRWVTVPQATQNVWATQLSKGYYRVATVEFFTVTAAHGALVEGTTDVEVGAPLKWDLSLDAWVDAGTTFTGAFCFHFQDDATPYECLVGFGHYAGGSGDTDCAGLDTVA